MDTYSLTETQYNRIFSLTENSKYVPLHVFKNVVGDDPESCDDVEDITDEYILLFNSTFPPTTAILQTVLSNERAARILSRLVYTNGAIEYRIEEFDLFVSKSIYCRNFSTLKAAEEAF